MSSETGNTPIFDACGPRAQAACHEIAKVADISIEDAAAILNRVRRDIFTRSTNPAFIATEFDQRLDAGTRACASDLFERLRAGRD